MFPAIAAMAAAPDRSGAFDAYLAELLRLQAAVNGMNVVMYLVMLVTWTAAARATLSPGRGDAFLFLRLGMDEVRVAVTLIAVFFVWYIVLLVLILIGVGIGMALWDQGQDHATAICALVAYGVLVFALSVWGWLRVSLIAPASLILKRFAFTEGWTIARGQVWKLLGLNLVIWVIYMVSALLMYAAVGGILAAGFFGQGLTWPRDIESIADLQPLFRPMLWPALATVIPFSLGFGWIMTLYAAPSIVAARQLLDGIPATHPIVEDAPPVDTLQPL